MDPASSAKSDDASSSGPSAIQSLRYATWIVLGVTVVAAVLGMWQSPASDPYSQVAGWKWFVTPGQRAGWRELPVVPGLRSVCVDAASGRAWAVGEGETILHPEDREIFKRAISAAQKHQQEFGINPFPSLG